MRKRGLRVVPGLLLQAKNEWIGRCGFKRRFEIRIVNGISWDSHASRALKKAAWPSMPSRRGSSCMQGQVPKMVRG